MRDRIEKFPIFEFSGASSCHGRLVGSWKSAGSCGRESLAATSANIFSILATKVDLLTTTPLLKALLVVEVVWAKKGLKFRNEQECASGPIYLYARLINWARLIAGKRNGGGDHPIVIRLNSIELQERMLISQKDLVSQGTRETNTSAVIWFVMNKMATLNNRCITLCEYWALSFSDVSSWERQ